VTSHLDVVFFDIGGVMYDDAVYREAIRRALRDLGASVTDEEFDEAYDRCRADQDGSFRRRLATRFFGPQADHRAVRARASRYWAYPPDALELDVIPCLQALSGRYRLGIIANQPSVVRDAMRRDGIEEFFQIWDVSDDLGLEKPDPRLYAHALESAGVEPGRAAMVGDRLDYDVRPARAAGMLAVWVLRGEAPDSPTASQLAEADASVRTLRELPSALNDLSRRGA
jgi:HAD superfamily hydrolase (TIGR01549 family)